MSQEKSYETMNAGEPSPSGSPWARQGTGARSSSRPRNAWRSDGPNSSDARDFHGAPAAFSSRTEEQSTPFEPNDGDSAKQSDSTDYTEKLTSSEIKLDDIINTSSELKEVIQTFEKFWQVSLGYADAGVSNWDIPTLRAIHAQLKRLPREHAKNTVWKKLLREPNGGGSMNRSGNFTFGEKATAATHLEKGAKQGTQELHVQSTNFFNVGDTVAIGDRPSPDTHKITHVDTATKTFKLDGTLSANYSSWTRIISDLTPRGKTKLTQAAKAGQNAISVDNTNLFAEGTRIVIGPRSKDNAYGIHTVTKTQFILDMALNHDYAADTEVANEAAPSSRNVSYGSSTSLTKATTVGTKDIYVKDQIFSIGDEIKFSLISPTEIFKINAVDSMSKKISLDTAVQKVYGEGTTVFPNKDSAARSVEWVGALVRHEIGHSVDTALGGVVGFTQLGGWVSDDNFDAWANKMGNAWTTNDGSTISDQEKKDIKSVIEAAKSKKSPAGIQLEANQPADHAINKYLNKDVPVIEAAKASVGVGKFYWTNPEKIYSNGSTRFAINPYYGKYHCFNEQVHTARVRDYSIFAPAEFFAECYTVFYEETGQVKDEDLGRLLPVEEWRNWIRENVHKRGLVPHKKNENAAASP